MLDAAPVHAKRGLMRIDLNYGREGLSLDLADDLDVSVIRKPDMPVLPAPDDAVREALAKPVGSPPLAELAKGKKTACILICDITRPVPNHLFLRPMIETLMAAGLPASGITVLVATGLHRPNEGEELLWERVVASSGFPGVLDVRVRIRLPQSLNPILEVTTYVAVQAP